MLVQNFPEQAQVPLRYRFSGEDRGRLENKHCQEGLIHSRTKDIVTQYLTLTRSITCL